MNQFEHSKVVGKRIAKLRRKYNISQQELANKVELSLFEVEHIERGILIPCNEKLCLFAEVLEVKVSDLNWVD